MVGFLIAGHIYHCTCCHDLLSQRFMSYVFSICKKKKKRKENVIGCNTGMTGWIIMRVFRVSRQLVPGGIIYSTKLLGKAQSHLD